MNTDNSYSGNRKDERSKPMIVMLSSFIGTAIEWYDFFLYGTVAALVFNELFFPTFDPLVGTIAAFATYAVGFIARPLGGVVFGHFGDRVGRKSMLMLTLTLMGVATVAVGLLPTYAAIGVAAPILLTLCRLIQGFALGGEWGGAVLVAVEHAPAHRRGFYGSWPQTGVAAGLLLSTGIFALFASLPDAAFMAWGWRVPFLLSAVLIAIGLVIRLRLAETPDFVKVRQQKEAAKLPIMDVLRDSGRPVMLLIGARLGELTLFYLIAVFALNYATQHVGLPRAPVLEGVTLAAAVALFSTPLYGLLSDYVGYQRMYLIGAAVMLAFAYPFFWLLDSGELLLVQAAIVIGIGLIYPMMYGPQAALFSMLFKPRVRYTGISLGVQAGSVIGGGMTPLVAATLVATVGGSWSVAMYTAIIAAIALVCTWLMGRYLPKGGDAPPAPSSKPFPSSQAIG